ncbi:DUF202 domain-containing protein [Sphingomicrobium astaxanthinifaciens]|uniref:DUF202 domain-containing protein n=1 Tax=Sphingomicrobium astaxanthinifaciens TaxID=1227949 RepID=UPI001FCB6C49|nr:DUF202 domain-containing protein [Sphingomicrobium astaxanthinifaciens]MCJ7421426.1 DUF202 domain-containing protein [Sphingomicrobium astaxanthinifaciens]
MVGGADSKDRSNHELAEDRTDLAEDRTIMAVERTMASWMGSGMGLIGLGLGLRALFGAFEPAWVPKAMATFFMLLAILVVQGAKRRMCSAINRMSANWVQEPSTKGMELVATGISAGAVMVAVGIWLFFG